MKTGLLGGSFNPVHNGHLTLAQDAREAFMLDRVVFIPCYTPPHKSSKNLISSDYRLHMLKLAIDQLVGMEVSDIEIQRGEVSYTIDTLKTLKEQWPGDDLYFIIGADMLLELHTWKDVYQILELCHIVTMARPGCDKPLTPESIQLQSPWPNELYKNIFQGHLVDISSTEIRERVRRGESIHDLVPSNVDVWILKEGVYRS